MRKNANTAIYNAWQNMRRRCYDVNNKEYSCYGGRGITFCKEWASFDTFNKDMSATWFEGARLDRINNDEGYTASNCRWVNATVSNRNRNYTKLTAQKADDIRELYKTKAFSQQELATAFNVSRQTIGYIVRGESWI